MPNSQTTLSFEGLGDSLLHDSEWLQQNSDLLQSTGDPDDVLGVIDVIFRQIPVQQVDAALIVDIVRRHIIRADQVVDAMPRTPHSCDHVVTRLQLCDMLSNRLNTPKPFVSRDKKLVTRGRRTVFRRIDLFISPINANT